ncbi:siderophore-interacting protein [Saccharopolyspora phatthalungensis]|uniref:NADPH-dependent ferric siderophore reductase n=1 Tax=Saccharopolyspora phatthalungensis TaxID=664693 RepID=A0A840QD81_9PSEU|nr:siderophore-interacting protein [Saccharopolyspora phatthalungensis]MBB5158356.1 NADPH-dependent ferric siderophore reductase [Saccharopolyspora phatthalungensis]
MTILSPPRPELVAEASPFRLFRIEVAGVRRLSWHLVRITFTGPELSAMASGGLDQRVKLIFPLPGQREPVVPDGARPYQALRSLPLEVRPKLRSYTVRAHRPEHGEFDVDFVLHGDTGPASEFAGRARAGDRLLVYAPNAECPAVQGRCGVEFRLDAVRDRVLLIGDETALPAIGNILAALPGGVRARVYVEIPDASDAQYLASAAQLELHWLPRHDRRPGDALGSAIRAASLPGEWYAWLAGETGTVASLRRHLIDERGFDRAAVTFMGYWRHGRSEDEPRA